MGGGGSESKSKSKQKSKTNVVNQSDLNLLNSTMNNTIVNTVVRNVQVCSATAISKQNLVLANIHTTGDIVIDTTQKQSTYLDFKCAQSADVRNDVIVNLTNQIMADIQNSYDNSVLNQFNAIAKADSKNEFGSVLGKGSKSNSKTNQNSKVDISNESNQNLQNLVSNAVDASFTNENLSSCLAKVIATQNTILKDISGRNFKFTSNQEQAIQLFSKCVQSSGVSNKITNSLANALDLKVKADVKNTATNDFSSEATSESVGGGPIQAIGEALAKPIDALLSPLNNLLNDLGFGNALSSLGSLAAPLVGICGSSSLCCCIIIVIFILFQFL